MIFTKNFTEDIKLIKENISFKKKFSFCKFADGERFILNNYKITNIDNWTFNPDDDSMFHEMLLDSFKFKDPNYFIGISCPCCDITSYDWYHKNKGSEDTNTTFANIFVNSNYEYFKSEILPLFNNYKRIFLIANKNSNLGNLKEILNFTDFYGIGHEAFKTDLYLIDTLINKINDENIQDSLFLFCAGPLGNVLSHKLWDSNKNNTYIDIGSTLNPWFNRDIRDYQFGGENTNKTCHF